MRRLATAVASNRGPETVETSSLAWDVAKRYLESQRTSMSTSCGLPSMQHLLKVELFGMPEVSVCSECIDVCRCASHTSRSMIPGGAVSVRAPAMQSMNRHASGRPLEEYARRILREGGVAASGNHSRLPARRAPRYSKPTREGPVRVRGRAYPVFRLAVGGACVGVCDPPAAMRESP
jgi:hypothetical protein